MLAYKRFAEVKKITGARLLIHEKDAPVLPDVGNSDYVKNVYSASTRQ